MAYYNSLLYYCILFFVFNINTNITEVIGHVPAVIVFGDSLVDVGNNNHLKLSILKSNFPHNGIDYPNKKATGRYSNGKNAADFFSENLGLAASPPYLSIKSASNKVNVLLDQGGINFASGGAGILNETNKLFTIYNLGARKFAVVGLGMIGCCPKLRRKNPTGECNEQANYWSVKYNKAVTSLLQELKEELTDIHYSLINTYDIMANFLQQPALYGFSEIKSACCGAGKFRAKVPCLPIAVYCKNRRDHVFWDLYHPTEAATKIIMNEFFMGTEKYVYPVNLKQLLEV
ncbi:hypothetical protein C5167_034968 [Papaver somniferum]|uniref:Uncharacterized protein n=1 Tax=Papaver somniferum TaxID=3469 RepID=A0A4Y7KHB5_PAPSO|nr:hypothetical protein C5167_034968 [Papaver somniferum]